MKNKTTIRIISICILILSVTLATAYVASPQIKEKLEETAITTYIYPTTVPPKPINEAFTVDLYVADATDLYAWGLSLSWNASILNCTSFTYNYSWFGPQANVIAMAGAINNTEGMFDPFYGATLTTVSGVIGSGSIAEIEFLVVGYGTTPINISVNNFLNSSGLEIPYSTINGSFTLLLPHGPTAVETHTPDSPYAKSLTMFNASGSQPGFNGAAYVPIANYTWNFGDGNTTTVTTPTIYHNYTDAGDYTVNLTVTCQDDPTLIANDLTSDTTSQNITVTSDTTPPTISDVTQNPAKTEVDADEAVTVTATVTDAGTGIHTVLLKYSTDNGTFTTVTMTLSTGNNYTAQIPGKAADTYVSYKIFANDTVGNSDETTLYWYRVKSAEAPSPSNLWLWVAIGIAIAAVVILVVVYLMRRKPA